ncbi:MAG: L-threonylcarbamoyladenylate synthase [Actinomycetota bacterium]|jgi:tRNA threonylcarbamoyl adenosine modification protein (Sua5/YciO/YrdC/YwlC family)|nr:L-threonylcarbamoyladenylate synthase [Actinomycetota bacterium]
MTMYDVTSDSAAGVTAAVNALQSGELVVMPTDTVYGIAADAFSPMAVNLLLAAKGRGRDMPVPVLVGSWRTLDGLVDELGPLARRMVETFWPGPLTLVVRSAPSLAWDLGETRGTVAVRMPLQPVALEILTQTGPLAVSSANRSGLPPAVDAADAQRQLGESVRVYLDGGPVGDPVPSTIVDLTGDHARVLRVGALDVDQLRELAPDLEVQQ